MKVHKFLQRSGGEVRVACKRTWSVYRATFRWLDVTCKHCLQRKLKPKPKIHKRNPAFSFLSICGLSSYCGEYKKWRIRWPGVTCGGCLRHKPKRRKR